MTSLAHTDPALTDETVGLLREMIRNRCVNDGRPESGEEIRNADLLETFLEGPGVELQTYEAAPGRRSLVTRLEGTDPGAPKVCLMGHTDVVPVTPEGWSRDPFGGELVDGEVWGRGAIDMYNLTASMAVAFRHLARSGFRPRGDLIYFAVADEEAGGAYGAEWLADRHWDEIGADYVLTEYGGLPTRTPEGKAVLIATAEKGIGWSRLTVRGTPGHGSIPFHTDNALVKAAEIIRRIDAYRPASHLGELWEHYVALTPFPDGVKDALRDPDAVYQTLESLPSEQAARHMHACCHTTLSPNVIHGGVKTNVIPDVVEIDVDIRIIPGDPDDASAHLRAALGDELFDQVEVTPLQQGPPTASSTRTPMWELLRRLVGTAHPDAKLVPSLMTGGTDARFYRQRGTVAYGAGLFSDRVRSSDFMSRFHGHDERVDVDSLALTTQLWLDVAHNFWDEAAS